MVVLVSESEVESHDGRHATVTLHAETTTPRRHTLLATFLRDRTPIADSRLARRQRRKNYGKARARALDRLDSVKNTENLEAERARRRAAPAHARAYPVSRNHARTEGAVVVRADLPSPAWKQNARERVAAELQRRDACEARSNEAKERWLKEAQDRFEEKHPGSECAKWILAGRPIAAEKPWCFSTPPNRDLGMSVNCLS
jgi:hypothetical protein